MSTDRPSLAAWRLELRALEPVRFPTWPGVTLHAALHRALEAHAPALAHAIHRAPIPPLTLSPLYRADGPPIEAELAAGETGWVRVCALDTASVAVFPAALEAWRTRRGPLRLAWAAVAIEALEPEGTPTSPQQLWDAALPAGEIHLHFSSPTVFRNKGGDLTTPEPRLVFGSFLRRWRALAGYPFPDIGTLTDEAAAAAVDLCAADLHWQQIELRAACHTTFTGTAHYNLTGDATVRRALATLADYAAWCGAGARTGFGFGQTARLR